MPRFSSWVFALIFGAIQPAYSACIDAGEAVCTSTACGEKFKVNSSSNIQVYRSYSLGKTHCAVTRAILVIHGRGGTGSDVFATMVDAAQVSGKLNNTLIIAPYFPDAKDGTQPLADSDLKWQRDVGSAATYDAAMGGVSVTPSQIGSFKIADDIILAIATSGRFPSLEFITVVGHSGGGQFTQRYAAVGNRQEPSAIRFHYVVANPSSYMYLDPKRPVSGFTTIFSVPSLPSCKYYNVYGYGLDDLHKNAYMSQLPASLIIDQYLPRKVTYLLGEQDTTTTNLDVSCYAQVEGLNRYTRGTAFSNYVTKYYPSATNHIRVAVPGVGHSASKMFKSAQGRTVLFAN